MNDKELMSFAIARSNDPIIKNSVLRDALAMDLGPRTNFDDGGKVDEVIGAYKKYLGMRKGKQRYKVIPFTTFFEEFARENFDDGGQARQLVKPSLDGSRPGYAPQPGWKEEKANFLKWLKDNPDYDFANSSTPKIIEKSGTKFEVGTIQKLLAEKGIQTKHSIARTQGTPKYTKKVLEELRKDLPPGVSVEQGRPGKYYFRIMLKGGKANKPTYRNSYVANEANKQVALDDFNKVSKEYYPGRLTNEEFKTLRLENKDMKTADFAKFLESEGKTTYLGDKWSKDSVSYLQNKLDIGVGTTGPITIRTVDESKKIIRQQPGAKFFFMGNPSDAEIKKYAANLAYQEKNLGKGGKKGFPVGMTKENKMFRNFYDSSLKTDGRIQLKSKIPMDEDGDTNWKMKDKDGTQEWKKAKFYDTKTGATYTWGKNYKPGNLRKQVDAAYGDGFFAKSVKVYDDQASLNKTTFQGKALNEWFREGLLQKEFKIKFNRKPTSSELKEWYRLRKPNFSFNEAHHVEGVGKNPFKMELATRAANRKQNTLLSKYKSGTLTKAEYIKEMENLGNTQGGIRYKTDGRYVGTTASKQDIVRATLKDAVNIKPGTPLYKAIMKFCPKDNGGTVGVCSLDEAARGMTEESKMLQSGKLNPAQAKSTAQKLNAARRVGTGSTLMAWLGPYGAAGEIAVEGMMLANDMLENGLSYEEALANSLLKYTLPNPGDRDPEKMKMERILGSDTKGLAADYVNSLQKSKDLQKAYDKNQRTTSEEFDIEGMDVYSGKDKLKSEKELERQTVRAIQQYKPRNIFEMIQFGSPEQQAFAAKEEVADVRLMEKNKMAYDKKLLGPLKNLFDTGFYSPAQLDMLDAKALSESKKIGKRSNELKTQEVANFGGVANRAQGGIMNIRKK